MYDQYRATSDALNALRFIGGGGGGGFLALDGGGGGGAFLELTSPPLASAAAVQLAARDMALPRPLPTEDGGLGGDLSRRLLCGGP